MLSDQRDQPPPHRRTVIPSTS